MSSRLRPSFQMRACAFVLALGAALIIAVQHTAASTIPYGASVAMTFSKEGPGQNLTWVYDGKTMTDFAGEYIWLPPKPFGNDGNPWPLNYQFASFCIDLNQVFYANQNYDYTVTDLQYAPKPNPDGGPNSTGMGQARADDLRRLWGQEFSSIGNDNIKAAAFQVAVWEIVFEYKTSTFDVSQADANRGDFYLCSSTANYQQILSQANTDLAAAINPNSKYQSQLAALTNGSAQDQLVVMPLPASSWMGLGLLGLFGLCKPLRRVVAC